MRDINWVLCSFARSDILALFVLNQEQKNMSYTSIGPALSLL